MANQRNAAVEDKIRNAEKIIQSYAYGKDLDQAIRYLKEHDPDNGVLATIKDFDNNRPLLKELNALYRADVARAENDTAELEKIAEFLSASKSKDLRKEALKMMRELPEIKENPEKGDAIEAMIAETDKMKHIQEKQETVQKQTPSMSDDAIVANAEKIDSILDGDDFRNVCINEINEVSKQVSIVDEAGAAVEDENEIWLTKMRAALNEVSMAHMDDAAFAAKSDDEQKDALKDDVITNFRGDMLQMLGDDDKAVKDFVDGKKVKIQADQFYSSIESTKEKMQDKADKLNEAGKEKSGSWLSRKLEKFNRFVEKHCGMTPVEFGRDLFGYFSHRRGITNTLAAAGMVGAALYSIPAGLTAATAFAVYQSFAPSKWTIWEKKHANYKAAQASGNEQEIANWKGWNGIRNAYKSIMANPKEKERFDRQRRTNRKYGLAAASIVGLATPVIVGGGALLGLAGAGAAMATRALSSGTRMVGGNVNAHAQMKEAEQQYQEDQTAESLKGYKKARTYFYLSILGTGLSEFCMANSAADAYNADYNMGVDHNPDHFAPLNDNQNEAPVADNDGNGGNAEATPVEVTHADWREGISAGQAKWIGNHVQGQAAEYAKIYGWDVNPDNMEEVTQRMADNIQKAIDNGALPDKPVGEIMYKYLHLIAWREKGEYVSGGLIQSTMVNGEPDYWTNATEIKALNHIIFCEEKVNVSADALGNTLDRITASGDDLDKSLDHLNNNRYVGTADLMHKAGDVNCAHVSYWEHFKAVVKKVVTPPEEPAPAPEPPAPAPEPAPAPVDGHADDGAVITTKEQPYKTGSHEGWMEKDKQSTDYAVPTGPKKVIPGSAVEAGAEKASSVSGNGDQALNAMIRSKMGKDMS